MAPETLAGWTATDLDRFVRSVVRSTPATLPRSLELEDLTSSGILVVKNNLQLSPQAIAYLHQVMGV